MTLEPVAVAIVKSKKSVDLPRISCLESGCGIGNPGISLVNNYYKRVIEYGPDGLMIIQWCRYKLFA